MTNYIVAIDLGTSHITGIVGSKDAGGTFSVVACETETPSSCIRRGNVYNLDDTAAHIEALISKLESKLKGDFIDKVYVGVGGQSLRTIDHTESKEIKEGEAITKEDLCTLRAQCEAYRPDLLDVLDIAPAVYYVDERREKNPVGVPCKCLEARYKLVVGRTSIRRDIINSIKKRTKKEVTGIIVAPLALADAMLSEEERELGCALVDFGAGVTSISVYKAGILVHMSVVPLGGNLITRDIASLQITEAEAEKLKKEYGNAVLQKDDDSSLVHVDMEGSEREIGINDLNAIVEARAKEIVENVYARISEVIELKSLGAGIVLAGNASSLKSLPDLIMEKCKVKARYSAIRAGLLHGSDELLGNPSYMLAVSLMLKGTDQCVSRPFETQDGEADVTEKDESEDKTKGGFFIRGKKNPKSPNSSKDGNSGKLGSFFGELFKED